MNCCFILLFLLFGCGCNNGRGNDCGCNNGRGNDCGCNNGRGNDCGCGNVNSGCERSRERERERDRRDNDCGCGCDNGMVPPPWVRSNDTCGCEEK